MKKYYLFLAVTFFLCQMYAQKVSSMLNINPIEMSLVDDELPFPLNIDFCKKNKIKGITMYKESKFGDNQWYPMFEDVELELDKNGILSQKILLGQEDTIYKPIYDTTYSRTYTYENGKIKEEFNIYFSNSFVIIEYTYLGDSLMWKHYYNSFHKSSGFVAHRYEHGLLVEQYDSSARQRKNYQYNAQGNILKQLTSYPNSPYYNCTTLFEYDSLQNLISIVKDGPYADRYMLEYSKDGWLVKLDRFEKTDEDKTKEELTCTMYLTYDSLGRILFIEKTGCTAPYWSTNHLGFFYTYY